MTWETCTLRSWLNIEFYEEAFSTEEQTAVKEVTITDSTTDKVYLLSINEASKKEYGFNEGSYVKATDYARMNGAYRSNVSDYAGNCYWWLRSPG